MARAFSASTLSAAVGLAFGLQMLPAFSDEMPQAVKDNMAQMKTHNLEKCFGINALGKNDCAEGAHSCAGQADKARDAKSFVLVPQGACDKIAGGKTKAS